MTSGGLLGVWGKWVKHAKYIYNIQDFNPEQVLAVGYTKSKFVTDAMMWFDKFSCKRSDLVITVGRDLVETVEVSLSRLQVVQSRGACNRNTEYHDRIVRLVNDNMSLVRAARHKRDKAPRIATLGRAASDRLKVSA